MALLAVCKTTNKETNNVTYSVQHGGGKRTRIGKTEYNEYLNFTRYPTNHWLSSDGIYQREFTEIKQC